MEYILMSVVENLMSLKHMTAGRIFIEKELHIDEVRAELVRQELPAHAIEGYLDDLNIGVRAARREAQGR